MLRERGEGRGARGEGRELLAAGQSLVSIAVLCTQPVSTRYLAHIKLRQYLLCDTLWEHNDELAQCRRWSQPSLSA